MSRGLPLALLGTLTSDPMIRASRLANSPVAGVALALIGITVAAVISLAAHSPVPQRVFRSGTRTVAVYASVRDTTGHLVIDLSRDSFEILEDGRPTEITLFSKELQPLSVVIMLDVSFSQTGFFVRVTQVGSSPRALNSSLNAALPSAVLSFVDALGPSDRASIGTFGMEIAVGANLTSDKRELARVLAEEVWGGGGTPLWQAIRSGVSSLAREPGRRVVLVLTDGRDSGALPGFPGGRAAAEAQALRDDCMIYVVRLGGSRDLPDEIVRLAARTGGGHIVLPRGGSLTEAFQRVADELRHQYLLGFVPAYDDGRLHQLEVRVTRPGLQVTARRGYVAEVAP